MMTYLSTLSIPELASIIGLIVTVIGFIVTIYSVGRSRSAANLAKEAADSARVRMMRFDVATGLTSAISMLEEIKRLQRDKSWQLLPERYGTLRKLLVSIRGAYPHISEADRSSIQSAIQHLANSERIVEKVIADVDTADVPKLNSRLSNLVDILQELLIEVKNREGGSDGN
ncbi:hypothetical protein KAT84_02245 [Candidatus Bipolaricaulota bacterium]|nr:hypothetical protein [Candidatus Bipolaricaulota bacterium]